MEVLDPRRNVSLHTCSIKLRRDALLQHAIIICDALGVSVLLFPRLSAKCANCHNNAAANHFEGCDVYPSPYNLRPAITPITLGLICNKSARTHSGEILDRRAANAGANAHSREPKTRTHAVNDNKFARIVGPHPWHCDHTLERTSAPAGCGRKPQTALEMKAK